MPSLPLTPQEEKQILSVLGLQSAEDLFVDIPPHIREKADFKFSESDNGRGLSEHELRQYFSDLSNKNAYSYTHFLGYGFYDNILPALVNQLVLRGEFLTCYTPYQPEISQGTLQAIFEFQTLICRLTGMQVANASMYDGHTATAEAVLMAQRLSQNKNARVLVSNALHPDTLSVCKTFLKGHTHSPVFVPWTKEGTVDKDFILNEIKKDMPAALIVGYPNSFGIIEPLSEIKRILPNEVLLITSTLDPTVFSLFEAPGNLQVDIAVGEAHQLGTPMLFGGPHVGFFTSKKEYLRQMPGRLVGETKDLNGKRAYTLTLSTREQHIRREKATSNICTNQGLIALRTAIYLSFLGKEGFQKLGTKNYSLFQYLTEQLSERGIQPLFSAPTYREGVFEVPNLKHRFEEAIKRRYLPGVLLNNRLTEESLLICVHPKHCKKDIDLLVEVLTHD